MRASAQGDAGPRAETPEVSGAATTPGAAGDELASAPGRPPSRDEARLLVQSPRRLFFYWNFARDPRPALDAALGEAAAKFRLAVRLVRADGDEEGATPVAAGDDNSFWFDALPGASYRAEVGFHAAGLPFVRVLSSDAVETPAAGVSAESDAAPEFRIGERRFALLLEGSGFARAARLTSSGALAARADAPEALSPASSGSRGASPSSRPSGADF